MHQVMDLPGWPPQCGEAFKPGEEIRTAAKQKKIDRLIGVKAGHITFACSCGKDRIEYYDLFVPDENMARKVVKILANNIGARLFEFGLAEITSD